MLIFHHGKEIVFDSLGIFIVCPSAEVKPKYWGGHALKCNRFSPDERKYCLHSDAGGGDNIWMMNRNGSNASTNYQRNVPVIEYATYPRFEYIIARKHFTSTRSRCRGNVALSYQWWRRFAVDNKKE
jgi:hypothetical protein